MAPTGVVPCLFQFVYIVVEEDVENKFLWSRKPKYGSSIFSLLKKKKTLNCHFSVINVEIS